MYARIDHYNEIGDYEGSTLQGPAPEYQIIETFHSTDAVEEYLNKHHIDEVEIIVDEL